MHMSSHYQTEGVMSQGDVRLAFTHLVGYVNKKEHGICNFAYVIGL